MGKPLAGKTALVTGSTRGIGYAIAQKLLDSGAAVIATGTSPDGTPPEGCRYRAVDFLDAEAMACFQAKVARDEIDILVNNAGINAINPFAEIPEKDFDAIHTVNLRVPFLITRTVLPGMKTRGWGRIINISSIFGKVSKEFRAAYSASKFGLDGMTAALAAEVASEGILANCVAPGFIDTELTRRVLGEDGIRELVGSVPIGRLGRPEEIAALVAWLAGPENTYLSGQTIVIDGGFTRV